jgi:hypothetical protein
VSLPKKTNKQPKGKFLLGAPTSERKAVSSAAKSIHELLGRDFGTRSKDRVIEYPAGLCEAIKDFFPDWKELHNELDNGSRQVVPMLSELPTTLDPRVVLKLWASSRDQIPVEAHRKIELSRMIADCQMALSLSLGPI